MSPPRPFAHHPYTPSPTPATKQPNPHTHQTAENYPVPELADEAKYITVATPSTKGLYCRLVVPNPTFMA